MKTTTEVKEQVNKSKINGYKKLISECITDNHFVSCYDCPAELSCILRVKVKNLSK